MNLKKKTFILNQNIYVADTQKNGLNLGSFEHPKHIIKLMGKKI